MYFSMHVHDQYSNVTAGLDSINKLSDLIKRAKQLGLSGLAITNHDNLSEVVDINIQQKQLKRENDNFTLAIGNEIYLIDNFDTEVKTRQKYYHFILIAKDKIGYDALIELSSRAWLRSGIQYGRRRVPTLKTDIEEVLKNSKGHLVATTACLGGEFPTLINQGNMVGAQRFLDWAQNQFGYDDFYIELQPSRSKEQINFNRTAITYNANFIIATDAHYQDAKDFPIFEAFMRSQQETREVQEFYEFARLMSEKEATELMQLSIGSDDIAKAFANTEKVRSQIEFYDLAQNPKIPKVPLVLPELQICKSVENYPTLTWALQEQDPQTLFCIRTCLNELQRRDKWNTLYLERLEHEFEVMKFQSESLHDNFFAYANTMRHFLDLAWSIDCAVGPSRGSASGSLLNYLMDIVQCDPIQYNLPFWRYLNKTRVTPLDIDTDFQPSKKLDLFEAIRKERGPLGLTQVATFRKLTLKAAIGNASRGYRSPDFPNGLDADISTYLSSLIEIKRGFVATLHQTFHGDETMGFNINHLFIKECKAYPGLLEIIEKFEGIIVGSSTHAAAVILFDDEDKVTDHCSLMRSPNGDLCTALDLYKVEQVGCYKYDFLLLSTLDVQATCFKLLQKDNVIPSNLTLKECFRTYINPNTLDFNQDKIWELLYEGTILSVFQWDAASGRKGLLAARPQSLAELSALNGLIRLMTAEDGEDQIERFVRNKQNPTLFEEEMVRAGLSSEQRQHMHNELDQYNGCAAMQESFMVLAQKLANYTLKQADGLRKTVAKKKMNEIAEQKELFFTQCEGSPEVKKYLWRTVIEPSLGYVFSLNHALPYSIVGIQCVLMGGILFPSIYWQTACLLQRSGALDGKSPDHNKIAKAASLLVRQGVNIRPIDINKSAREFTLDAQNERIYFGFNAIKGLKEKVIDSILELRPFNSMLDCIIRTRADITSIVALIKAGAFDSFNTKENNIEIISKLKSGLKEKLNGQNYLMLSREGHWPQDSQELIMSQRVLNFTHYLKAINKIQKKKTGSIDTQDTKDDEDEDGDEDDIREKTEHYKLNDITCNFLDEIGYEHDGETISKKQWKSYYDVMLKPMKDYLLTHQEEMLNKVNQKIIATWLNKYFSNNDIAQWEIETMGLCFAEHPYKNVINVDNFDDLPQEPEIATFYKIKGRRIPLYKLTMICGIVIAKDKLHSSITLLTAHGPVDVKFRKEQFAFYDKQVSRQENGKKKVVERSWLNRGIGLIVHGMRQDDLFLAKTYKNSPMQHTAYKITSVLDSGKIEVQKERKKGKLEESNDDDGIE